MQREQESEATALWPLVDTFLATVGPGVMKVLLLDRGFINGAQIGRLKQEQGVDTVIPIRSDMNLQEDVRGLMELHTTWEEYQPTHRAPLPDVTAASYGQPPHPTAKKRERTRQKTLAQQRAERAQQSPPDPSRVREKTLIARFPGLTSWWECPVPLTGVYSRDLYADGHEQSWLLVTTNPDWSASRVRDRYALRTDIEERHRQVKCFWDLTRFHSTSWSLIVSQTVFVCLTYSLLQIHLLQQGHQELTQPAKTILLNVLTARVLFRGQTGPLMPTLHRYVYSLSNCFAGKLKQLDFPEFIIAEVENSQQESKSSKLEAGPCLLTGIDACGY